LDLFPIFTNNKVGGDIIFIRNQLLFFWKVGKFLVEKRYCCNNVVLKSSNFLSYYFGNSKVFSYENVIFMRKFYLYFPIFLDSMYQLDWDSYLILMKLKNRNMCYFYYQLALFCDFCYYDLKCAIDSNIFYRI